MNKKLSNRALRKQLSSQAQKICADLYCLIKDCGQIKVSNKVLISKKYPFPITVKDQIKKYDLIYSCYKDNDDYILKKQSIPELLIICLDAFWFVSSFIRTNSQLEKMKIIYSNLFFFNHNNLTFNNFKIIIFQLSFIISYANKIDELKWKIDLDYFKLPHVELGDDSWFDLKNYNSSNNNIFKIINHFNHYNFNFPYVVFTSRKGISPSLKIDCLFKETHPTWLSEFKSPRRKGYLTHGGFFNHPAMHLWHDWGHERNFKKNLLTYYLVMQREIDERKNRYSPKAIEALKNIDFIMLHERSFTFKKYLKNNEGGELQEEYPLENFMNSKDFFNSLCIDKKDFFSIFICIIKEIIFVLHKKYDCDHFKYYVNFLNSKNKIFDITVIFNLKKNTNKKVNFRIVLFKNYKCINSYNIKVINNKHQILYKFKDLTCKPIYTKFDESYADIQYLLEQYLHKISGNTTEETSDIQNKIANIKHQIEVFHKSLERFMK